MALLDDFMRGAAVLHCKDQERLKAVAAWIARRVRPRPGASVLEMSALAERYLFENSPSEAVQSMSSLGVEDYGLVLEASGLVASPVWVEMPLEYDSGRRVKLGAMAEEQNGNTVIAYVVQDPSHYGGVPAVLGYLRTGAFPLPRSEQIPFDVVAWATDRDPTPEEAGSYLFDFVDAMFLLSVPRTHEVRTVTHHRKLQAAREKRGRAPLLEYRSVRIKIGEGAPRYVGSRSQGGDIGHRKYHQVVGHVRVYREGRERPHVTFVPHHWRGDPKLGIVLHDRSVR